MTKYQSAQIDTFRVAHIHTYIKDLEHEALKRITFVFQMDYLRFDDIFVYFVTFHSLFSPSISMW